jgi:hypothetical protein
VPVINITALAAPIRQAEPPSHDLSLQEAVDFMAGAGMNVITIGFDEPTTKEGGE